MMGVGVNEKVVMGVVIGLFGLLILALLLKLINTRKYPVPPAGGAIVITGESMPHFPCKYPFRNPRQESTARS
jgi:hypothetical protein